MKFVKSLMAAALLSTAIAGSAFAAAPLDESKDKVGSLSRFGFDNATSILNLSDGALEALASQNDVTQGSNAPAKNLKTVLAAGFAAMKPKFDDGAGGFDLAAAKAYLAANPLTVDLGGYVWGDAKVVPVASKFFADAVAAWLNPEHSSVTDANKLGLSFKSAGGTIYGKGHRAFNDLRADLDTQGLLSAGGSKPSTSIAAKKKEISDLTDAGKQFGMLAALSGEEKADFVEKLHAYVKATAPKLDLTNDATVEAEVVRKPAVLEKVIELAAVTDEDAFLAQAIKHSEKIRAGADMLDKLEAEVVGTFSGFSSLTGDDFVKGVEAINKRVKDLEAALKAEKSKGGAAVPAVAAAAPKAAAKPADVGVPAVAAAPKAASRPGTPKADNGDDAAYNPFA